MGFWLVAFWIVSTILSYVLQKALAPKVAKRGPGELQAPICEQGYPIPVLYGCAKVRGVNVVWSGTPDIWGSDKKGWNYALSMQLAICHGPVDMIRRIWIGDQVATVTIRKKPGGISPTISNEMGVTDVTKEDTAPAAVVGDIYLIGDNPDASWGMPAFMMAARKGFWAKYVSWVETTITGPVTHYGWTFYIPVTGASVNISGNPFRWNGTTWVSIADVYSGTALGFAGGVKNDSIEASGNMTFYYGLSNQEESAFLKTKARGGGVCPAYRGLSYLVLENSSTNEYSPFYWGKSAYIPELAIEIQNTPDPLSLGRTNITAPDGSVIASWPHFAPSLTDTYATALNVIDDDKRGLNKNLCYDANPANILYDLMTNTVYGLGMSAGIIDTTSFFEAGRFLGAEQFGITLLLDQQGTADDVIADILKTIDGMLFIDPSTGKWVLRLIREPVSNTIATQIGLTSGWYTNTTFPTFDEDDVIGTPEYARSSWADVANEVKVQYIDRGENYAQRFVQVQDIGNYIIQGGEIVSVSNVYNGVTSRELAIRLAWRDLRTIGYPRSRIKLVLNRRAWNLRPGDRFVLNYPTLGISNMQLRIGEIRYGTMEDQRIEIQAIEDTFALATTIYSEPGSGWVDPSTVAPVAPAAVRLWEAPYDVTGDGPRASNVLLVARGGSGTTWHKLWRVESGVLSEVTRIAASPTALLSGSMSIEESTASITIQGLNDIATFTPIGDATGGRNLLLVDDELIGFSTLAINDDGTATLGGLLRGVLDTVPATHSAGARIWIVRDPDIAGQDTNGNNIADTNNKTEIVVVQAGNDNTALDVYTQPQYAATTNSRQLRPYPPGKLRVDAATDLPTTMDPRIVVADVDTTWKHRNGLTQRPGVTAQDADTVAPPAGRTYTHRLLQGLSGLFQLQKLDGSVFPLDQWVAISGSPWAKTAASTYLSEVSGLKSYAATNIAAPSIPMDGSLVTNYIAVNLETGTVGLTGAEADPWVTLYMATAYYDVGAATYKVWIHDRRGTFRLNPGVDETPLVASSTAGLDQHPVASLDAIFQIVGDTQLVMWGAAKTRGIAAEFEVDEIDTLSVPGFTTFQALCFGVRSGQGPAVGSGGVAMMASNFSSSVIANLPVLSVAGVDKVDGSPPPPSRTTRTVKIRYVGGVAAGDAQNTAERVWIQYSTGESGTSPWLDLASNAATRNFYLHLLDRGTTGGHPALSVSCEFAYSTAQQATVKNLRVWTNVTREAAEAFLMSGVADEEMVLETTGITGETHTTTATEAAASLIPATIPYGSEVNSVESDLESLFDRRTGKLYWAGYGMAYGLHFGGKA